VDWHDLEFNLNEGDLDFSWELILPPMGNDISEREYLPFTSKPRETSFKGK